jgi:hypothetical protein
MTNRPIKLPVLSAVALFALVAFALSAALAPISIASVPIGNLAGVVLDVHGQPVPNAAVTIQTSDGTQPFATRTDAAGHFLFTRLETGQYDLRAASGKRVSEWSKRIMVRSRKTTEVTLRLAPEKA